MAPSSPITSTVKEVTLFKHPLSDETFTTKAAATRAHTAALAAKGRDDEKARTFAANRALADSVRLRAESVSQIPVLLAEVVQQAFGAKLTITQWDVHFGQHSISHCTPIGVKPEWDTHKTCLGWEGQIAGHVNGGKGSLGLSVLRDGYGLCAGPTPVPGFSLPYLHTGTGSPGNPFDISFSFWLSDFPLILAKHARFEALTTERAAFRAAQVRHNGEVAKLVGTDSTWLGLTARAQEMRTTAAALEGQADERAQSIKDAHPLVQPSAFSPEEVASLQADFGRGY